MNRSILIEEYLNVREKTVTAANITKAWEKCGLHPFNANIFSGYDFGPCQASSTVASFPASFPVCTQCMLPDIDDETPSDEDFAAEDDDDSDCSSDGESDNAPPQTQDIFI